MKFYLAGKVPKGAELETYQDWRVPYADLLCAAFPGVEIFDPHSAEVSVPLSDQDPFFWFGQDAWLVREADVTLVQGDIKMGAGTAQEMLIAKYFNKPVVTIAPRNTHYHRMNVKMRSGIVEEWFHPFVHSTSDLIVDHIEEALPWLRAYQEGTLTAPIKGIEIIEKAIDYARDLDATHKPA